MPANVAPTSPEVDAGWGSAEGLGQRIAEAAANLGARKDAAAVMGVSTDALARYIRGENQPGFATVAALARASCTPLSWLAYGEDFAAEDPVGQEGGAVDSFVRVPLYDCFDAYQIASHAPRVNFPCRREWFQRQGVTPEALVLLKAEGDAMEPTIRQGSLLLVDTAQSCGRKEGFYALPVEEMLVVKRLQIDLRGGMIVKSDNPRYEDQCLNAREVQDMAVVGRVIWYGTCLLA